MCFPPAAVTVVAAPKDRHQSDESGFDSSSSKKVAVPSARALKIAKLNERVKVLTARAVARSQANGTKLEPEFEHAQHAMTVVTAGYPIYQLRYAPLVYAYTLIAASFFVCGASQLHPLVSLACVGAMFLCYDIYSGITHVVFDHPDNIALPILGQPCLEFQWHHSIPDDLVRKDFVDVCGDLNTVMAIVIAINLCLLPLDSGVGLLLGGLKIFMAYFGQFSHRSAHSVGKSLGPVAKQLQQMGIMVSTKDHISHHQPPYDVDFCLIGPCNVLIDGMRKVTQCNALWMSLFLLWSIFDVYALTHAVEKAANYFGY